MSVEERDEELERHLQVILQRVQDELTAQGLPAEDVDLGLIRIMNRVSVEYWTSHHDQVMEEQTRKVKIITEPANVAVQGKLTTGNMIVAVAEDGSRLPVGFVPLEGNCMYTPGHRTTIKKDGEIVTLHPNGQRCGVECVGCENPSLYVRSEEEGLVVYCRNCGTHTDSYADQFIALAAFLVDKVTFGE